MNPKKKPYPFSIDTMTVPIRRNTPMMQKPITTISPFSQSTARKIEAINKHTPIIAII
jgi:hypothetical protein